MDSLPISFILLAGFSSMNCGTVVPVSLWLLARGYSQLLRATHIHSFTNGLLSPSAKPAMVDQVLFKLWIFYAPAFCFSPEKILLFKGPYDWIGHSWIIHNLTILRSVLFIIPTKYLLPCNKTYSQVPEINSWTSFFCLFFHGIIMLGEEDNIIPALQMKKSRFSVAKLI